MPNLDAIRTRVERAERNLQTAQTARETESQALVEMWRQIRDRFENKEIEVDNTRATLAALEDENAELTRMVEALLAVVERSVGRSGEETVPRIAGLAEALIEGRDDSEPDFEPESVPAEPASEPELHPAKRHIRDLVSRVAEAHRAGRANDGADEVVPAHERERRDIEALRAELDEIGERLGAYNVQVR
jgi:predicted  nucleic acid-binding Zn-ribbon protein